MLKQRDFCMRECFSLNFTSMECAEELKKKSRNTNTCIESTLYIPMVIVIRKFSITKGKSQIFSFIAAPSCLRPHFCGKATRDPFCRRFLLGDPRSRSTRKKVAQDRNVHRSAYQYFQLCCWRLSTFILTFPKETDINFT